MKKALILLLTLALVITSFTTVSFAADDLKISLDAYRDGEKITPSSDDGFDVLLYANKKVSSIYTYQIGIDYDPEYFELKEIKSKAEDGIKGIEVVDEEEGKLDFAYYIGNENLKEDSDTERYMLAILTFETLKAVDKNLAIEIDDERTILLDENADELDFETDDFDILIPEPPYKTSPSSNKFSSGSYLKLATNTKNADIYYTTDADEVPATKYNGSIKLPNKSVTYYAIARRYGIESTKATIKMSFQSGGGNGGSSSIGGSSSRPGGSGYYPSTSTTTNTNTNTNTNTTAQEKYADIKGHWAESYIKDLIDKKIINGYEDGTVKPANTVTRAEVAKIIVCALGQSEAANITLDFADTGSIADWAKGYIQAAVNLGILNGYEDNTFKPTQPVTRQELAKIAMVAFKMGESQKALAFADKDAIPAWSVGYISAAVENGIITGYEDNTFKPTGNVTRAEICTIVSKCLK